MIQHITLEITELAGLGDGVGYLQDKKVFVPYTVPGDKVSATIYKHTKQQAFASLGQVIVPGSQRVTPVCRHFYHCGGCRLQHVNSDAYQVFKQQMLTYAVSRAGYDPAVVVTPVMVGAKARRRAVFKVHQKQVGYYEPKSHKLVAISECPILVPELEALIASLNTFLQHFSKPQLIEEIALFQSDSGVDMVFTSNIEVWDATTYEQVTGFSQQNDIARVSYRYKSEVFPVIQRRSVQMQAGEVSIDLPPGAFQQATKAGQEAITAEILQGIKGASKVIDLYAGCGTYTFPIAAFAKVHAVEGSQEMVSAINQTAGRQHISGVCAEMRDLVKQPVPAKTLKSYDAIVINPPRNGAGAQVEEIAKSGVKRMVMVSCNPVTFSEDAKLLKAAGYALKRAVPIDQFVWSSHLELVAVFEKNA